MSIYALKCPACGADIELDESREFGFCQYCGTKILRDKQIIEHRGSVSIDYSKEIDNLLARAEEMLNRGAYDAAENYYTRVLDIDATNEIAKENIEKLYKIIKNPNLLLNLKTGTFYSNKVEVMIKIDGVKAGTIEVNKPRKFTLSVGHHTIEVRIKQTLSKAKTDVYIEDRFTKCQHTILCKFGNIIEFVN